MSVCNCYQSFHGVCNSYQCSHECLQLLSEFSRMSAIVIRVFTSVCNCYQGFHECLQLLSKFSRVSAIVIKFRDFCMNFSLLYSK
jgi:hypothetical protein